MNSVLKDTSIQLKERLSMQLIQYILMKIEDISVQKINSNIFNYICNCVEQETPVPHNLFFYLRKEFFMSKRKFFITGTVVGSLLLTQSVFAAEITATPSQKPRCRTDSPFSTAARNF